MTLFAVEINTPKRTAEAKFTADWTLRGPVGGEIRSGGRGRKYFNLLYVVP